RVTRDLRRSATMKPGHARAGPPLRATESRAKPPERRVRMATPKGIARPDLPLPARRYRAVSVRQPLANLIMSGRMLPTGSAVDNRATSTAYRGTLVLHASARWEPAAAVLA